MYDLFLSFDGGSNLDIEIGKTGVAIYDIQDESQIESSRVYRGVTNNYCELKALAEGMDMIVKAHRKLRGEKLRILVIGDSQYVLNSFKDWVKKWSKPGPNATWFSSSGPLLNQEVIKYIYYNYTSRDDEYELSYLHVKGHLNPDKDADVKKMQAHFEKQGYRFSFETTKFILQLNNRADELSSCMNIDKDGYPKK